MYKSAVSVISTHIGSISVQQYERISCKYHANNLILNTFWSQIVFNLWCINFLRHLNFSSEIKDLCPTNNALEIFLPQVRYEN